VPTDLATLPDDPEVVAAAAQQQARLQDAVSERDAEIEKLQLLIQRLLRQQFGRRSEKLSPDQLQLGLEDLEQDIAASEAAREAMSAQDGPVRSRRQTQANRNHDALPSLLPRYEVLIDIGRRDCPCCGGLLHPIGELRSEQLDIVPAQLRVRVTRRRRSGQSTAAWRPRRWWCMSWSASSATRCRCMAVKGAGAAGDRARSLDVEQLGWPRLLVADAALRVAAQQAMSSAKPFADDSTLPVLDPGRGKTKTRRLWCYASMTGRGPD
jgi:transposase